MKIPLLTSLVLLSALPLLTPKALCQAKPKQEGVKVVMKPRSIYPVRLGGVYLYGLGESSDPMENSAKAGTPLSQANQKFITDYLDAVALPANSITPQTYPKMLKEQPLLVPLLYLSGSTLYEQENYPGNVGGWKPSMIEWTLRDEAGKEITHPDASGHWMDMGNPDWARHWRRTAGQKVQNYGAIGTVVSEMLLGNAFLPENVSKYPTLKERGEATALWLQRVHGDFALYPSSIGFDRFVGHSVPAVAEVFREPELSGRQWDYLHPFMDGAWCEDWLYPYWSDYANPMGQRSVQLAAGKRFSKNGMTFIATAAYHNDGELETLLAYFLLVSQKQGTMVFQPMPILPNMPKEAGLSLAVLKQQVKEKASLLQAPLGWAIEPLMHILCEEGRVVLRRRYTNGVVYANPEDKSPAHLNLGSSMQRVNGEKVGYIDLPPNSGVILYYPKLTNTAPKKTQTTTDKKIKIIPKKG